MTVNFVSPLNCNTVFTNSAAGKFGQVRHDRTTGNHREEDLKIGKTFLN